MSDFNKWLNLRPVTRDTTGANTKWDSLRRASAIQKLNYTFTLPAFSELPARIIYVSHIVHQYNFTLPSVFTILNWQDVVNALPIVPGATLSNFCLAIRYREGNIVKRYRFNSMEGVVINEPFYNGELIQPNFVLEIWTSRIYIEQEDPTVALLSNPADILFTSSIQFDPATPMDINVDIPFVSEATGALPPFEPGDLFISMEIDAPLPLEFDAKGPFLTN